MACDGENVAQSVDVRCSLVDIAEDYTKRKHVLRLANPNAEVLLQTEDAASMALWLRALHEHAAVEKPSVSLKMLQLPIIRILNISRKKFLYLFLYLYFL